MKKTKILIIDDEVAFTNIVKLTLELRVDYEIFAENNPLLAIATAETFKPDIILLDVIMPESDGGQLYMQFKANTFLRHIPIIFLTAIVRQEDVDPNNGMIGGRSYIAKPVSADGLVKAIEKTAGKPRKREPKGKVKKEILAYLEKFPQSRAIEIANLTGLKVTSVRQTLVRLKKSGVYNLDRFVSAQNPVFEQVCSELREGRKKSHWMWFIFPQISGLGSSPLAVKFAISSLKEAEAYLKHPTLGPRLEECTKLVTLVDGRSIDEIFGCPDNLKFHSSMTLFSYVPEANPVFKEALQKYFGGEFDHLTVERL